MGANLQDFLITRFVPEVLHKKYIGPLPFPFNQEILSKIAYTICKRTITKGLCRFLNEVGLGPTDGPDVSFLVMARKVPDKREGNI